MKKVNIKDVAKHAGVSTATITRVINKSGYVSDVTRQRVEDSIRVLGYIPNRMASALKNNSTHVIGNVFGYTGNNPFFLYMEDAIKKHAEQAGYQMISVWNSMSEEKEGELIEKLIGQMVEGIIFIGDVMSEPAIIQRIIDQRTPVIMVERPLDIYGVDKILIDDIEGSTIAADMLIAAGHRHIAYIGAQDGSQVCINRFEGFSRTLERHRLELSARDICYTRTYEVESGYTAMKELLDRYPENERPTACFISSDTLACGALQYLYKADLRVPDAISVIGYNNSLARMTSPPISTIAFPFEEIGKAAIELFLERKEKGRTSGKTLVLSPYYIDRNSVRKV